MLPLRIGTYVPKRDNGDLTENVDGFSSQGRSANSQESCQPVLPAHPSN